MNVVSQKLDWQEIGLWLAWSSLARWIMNTCTIMCLLSQLPYSADLKWSLAGCWKCRVFWYTKVLIDCSLRRNSVSIASGTKLCSCPLISARIRRDFRSQSLSAHQVSLCQFLMVNCPFCEYLRCIWYNSQNLIHMVYIIKTRV